jgi:uncharacterized repeat protein (TIGR03803 family)
MRSRKKFAGVVLAVVASSLTMVGDAAAQTEAVLYNFSAADGYPLSGVIRDAAGNLYGTTSDGPTFRGGTVFKLTPGAGGTWTHTVLHSFTGGTDGFEPAGLVLDAAGNLYGTTAEGGGGSCARARTVVGCGTVFELSPGVGDVWTEKILHVFGIRAKDGVTPYSNLIFDSAGNLYGTTSLGGVINDDSNCEQYGTNVPAGCGTVFELKPAKNGAWNEQILHNFGYSPDGQIPVTGVTFDASGNLYGTTSSGGRAVCGENGKMAICGTIFELIPEGASGWKEKQLILGDQGFFANLAIDPAGNLYVAADSGGGCGNDYNLGCGITFELPPTEHGETIGDFGAASDPSPLILDPQGNVYGTADNILNEDIHQAIVYEASQNSSGSWAFTPLYFFNSALSGAGPSGGLVRDDAGNLYGTTRYGGKHNLGVVFELTP